MTPKTSRLFAYLIAAGVAAGATVPAFAADKLKVAISQRGFWNSAIAYFAIARGFTKKENLDVSYIFTSGGAETLQTVTTKATDIAISTGFLGVLGAYAKGAPLRIWAQEGHGTPELFHYVRADSPIKSRKDYSGRKIAYSRPGSTTNLFGIKVTQGLNPPATLVSTGGVPATRTQVMTGQVDVGWSVPPFNLDLVRKGEARIVLRGSEMPELNRQSIRVHVVHADLLKSRRDVVRRFAKAFDDALTWMYDKPEEGVRGVREDFAAGREGVDPILPPCRSRACADHWRRPNHEGGGRQQIHQGTADPGATRRVDPDRLRPEERPEVRAAPVGILDRQSDAARSNTGDGAGEKRARHHRYLDDVRGGDRAVRARARRGVAVGARG
jgi:NitT/TauT family transport system substrate-binding protein